MLLRIHSILCAAHMSLCCVRTHDPCSKKRFFGGVKMILIRGQSDRTVSLLTIMGFTKIQQHPCNTSVFTYGINVFLNGFTQKLLLICSSYQMDDYIVAAANLIRIKFFKMMIFAYIWLPSYRHRIIVFHIKLWTHIQLWAKADILFSRIWCRNLIRSTKACSISLKIISFDGAYSILQFMSDEKDLFHWNLYESNKSITNVSYVVWLVVKIMEYEFQLTQMLLNTNDDCINLAMALCEQSCTQYMVSSNSISDLAHFYEQMTSAFFNCGIGKVTFDVHTPSHWIENTS